MKKIDLGQAAQMFANLGVIVSLVFLAYEIRTNTAANEILIFQVSSSNWMELNGQRANNRELAVLLQAALSGDQLDAAAQWQFEGWIRQHLTHAAFMRRLHDAGLLSDEQFEGELSDIRTYAENERVREVLERLLVHNDSFRDLILR
jgi:hypothetical protein